MNNNLDDERKEQLLQEEQNNNDFYNQNLNSKLRNIKNKGNSNQNTISRLKQRNSNTLAKGVENSKSAPSTSNESQEDLPEKQQKSSSLSLLKNKISSFNNLGGLSGLGKNATKYLGNMTKEAGKAAGKVIASTAVKISAFIISNPICWIFIGLAILILIFPILFIAIDSSGGSSGGSYADNGSFESECDFNLTRVNLKLDDGTEVASNLNLDDYIIGVAYAEIGEYIYQEGYEEYAKVAMITAKTYSLRVGEYNNTDKEINLKSSTAHHAWCDINNGCYYYYNNGVHWYYPQNSGITKDGAQIYKPALNETNLKKARETYSQVRNYLYAPSDFKETLTKGTQLEATEYRNHTQNFWKKLAESGYTFEQILEATGTNKYTDYESSDTAIRIKGIYSELSLYNLSSYCKFNAIVGNCITSTPIKISDSENFIISSPFGKRDKPCATCSSNHQGIDLAYPGGTPIYSIADGTVVAAGFHYSAGNFVNIGYDLDGDGTYDYITNNYHMVRKTTLSVGEKVTGGQQVGSVGTTGSSTGNHLHFGIKDSDGNYIDPKPILDALRTKTSVFDNAAVCKNSSGGFIGEYPQYSQCDSNWAEQKICDGSDYVDGVCVATETICTSGCGYTAFSMIASGINGDSKLKPSTVVPVLSKYSYNPNGGAITNAALIDETALSNFNMRAEVLFPEGTSLSLAEKKEKILSALRAGKPVELLVPRHYVALVGINGEKIKLNDSGRPSNVGEYTIDELNNLFIQQRGCPNNDCFKYAIAYSKVGD